ncbi:hypothetical protein E1262_22390 [Jiangella aurantiaca]|uniref:HEPN domain-containing protein n=1 Tax=Jiangella aurantiaca TaxID=2530373 RepID=A0A4R5A4B3_9ACTN|nr:hypothetical protein [Jiangella aurantiaca]TDD66355.1 hypothetical protein E1262_22390 [Jiangella aurantiaca]
MERLLKEGRLEPITGAAAAGDMHLQSARAMLASAEREADHNPEAAYVLAYDAVRKAATGLLAQQALRPRQNGHHVTVEEAVRAQFNGDFHEMAALRRRRGEIEYPIAPGDNVTSEEVADAIQVSARIVAAAGTILPTLSFYR